MQCFCVSIKSHVLQAKVYIYINVYTYIFAHLSHFKDCTVGIWSACTLSSRSGPTGRTKART